MLAMIQKAMDQPEDTFAEITEEITVHADKGPGDKDPQEIIIGMRCIPFRDRLKRNLGTVTVFHDITALKMRTRSNRTLFPWWPMKSRARLTPY